jgi:hypothetical protein
MGGRTRQPARCVRWRNRRTGPARGVAAGHQETESRFLGRAPAAEVGQVPGVRSLGMTDRVCGSDFPGSAPLRAPAGRKRGCHSEARPHCHRDARSAGCRAEESTVGPWEAGRGSPHHTCGGETAGQGRPGVSRRATRKRKVDSSVAHRLSGSARCRVCAPWNDRSGVRPVTSWIQRRSAHLLDEDKAVIPRPGRAAIGLSRCRLQGRGIYRRPMRGRTRQPAPSLRWRNSQTGPARGVAAGHQETESRFLGRAPALGLGQGAGCALLRNDRLGGREVTSGPPVLRAPCWTQTRLSFRGPAALQSEGCRAEGSTVVGPWEAGRGSPRNTCGGETAGQGRSGASRRATRKRKADSSVAHRLLWSGRCRVCAPSE